MHLLTLSSTAVTEGRRRSLEGIGPALRISTWEAGLLFFGLNLIWGLLVIGQL